MKKSILFVAALFSIAVMFTSCKESKKEGDKREHHKERAHDREECGHDHKGPRHDARVAAYKCPMDCEKGKSYEEAGSCPVCKMDLKKQSPKKGPKHAEGCTCVKDGGECTCEDGKCDCKAKTAAAVKECGKCDPADCKGKKKIAEAKECAKCEPGACECKA